MLHIKCYYINAEDCLHFRLQSNNCNNYIYARCSRDITFQSHCFGTGYSSLSLLHNIDADVIKIDKSFTDMITVDDKTAILVESIITIAQRLKMEIIAEGVETKEQGKKKHEI